jgi:hypothetical protein
MIKINTGAIKRHVWALPFEIIIVLSLLVFVWTGQYAYASLSVFLLAACAVLPIIEQAWHLRLSPLVHVCYVGFLFASLFAGEMLDMYSVIPLWDDGLHFASGLLVGLGGIIWLTTMTQREVLQAPVWLQVVIVIALGALIAVAWELVEFVADQWLGTFMQRDDLFDTMTDFVYGMAGVTIMAGLFSRYLKQHYSLGIGRILVRQRQLND